MLNYTQAHILRVILDEIFDDELLYGSLSKCLHPRDVIYMLETILERTELASVVFTNKELLHIATRLIEILRHECPYNRTASSVYIPIEGGNSCVLEKDLGFVYFRNEAGGKLCYEKRGILGLSARNDASCKPVDRKDVVFFVRERIEQELRLQRARLALIEDQEYIKPKEEYKYDSISDRVEELLKSCQVEEATKLLRAAGEQDALKNKTQCLSDQLYLAIAQEALVHHIQGSLDLALDSVDRLRIVATTMCSPLYLHDALVSFLCVHRILSFDAKEVDISEIIRVINSLREEHEDLVSLRLHLCLALIAQNRDIKEAARILLQVVQQLPRQDLAAKTEELYFRIVDMARGVVDPGVAIIVGEIREKLASASPPSDVACLHWMRSVSSPEILNEQYHRERLLTVMRSYNFDASSRLDGIVLFAAASFCNAQEVCKKHFLDILRSEDCLERLDSAILINTSMEIFDGKDEEVNKEVSLKILSKPGEGMQTRARALLVLGRSSLVDSSYRIYYIKEVINLGCCEESICLTYLANAHLVRANKMDVDEAEKASLAALESGNVVQIAQALLAFARVSSHLQYANPCLDLFEKHFDGSIRVLYLMREQLELHKHYVHAQCKHFKLRQAMQRAREAKALCATSNNLDPYSRLDLLDIFYTCRNCSFEVLDIEVAVECQQEFLLFCHDSSRRLDEFLRFFVLFPYMDIEEPALSTLKYLSYQYLDEATNKRDKRHKSFARISIALVEDTTEISTDTVTTIFRSGIGWTDLRVTCLMMRGCLLYQADDPKAIRVFEETDRILRSNSDVTIISHMLLEEFVQDFTELLCDEEQDRLPFALGFIEFMEKRFSALSSILKAKAAIHLAFFYNRGDKKHLDAAIATLSRAIADRAARDKAEIVYSQTEFFKLSLALCLAHAKRFDEAFKLLGECKQSFADDEHKQVSLDTTIQVRLLSIHHALEYNSGNWTNACNELNQAYNLIKELGEMPKGKERSKELCYHLYAVRKDLQQKVPPSPRKPSTVCSKAIEQTKEPSATDTVTK